MWDLERDKYHVMLARGKVAETGRLKYHEAKVSRLLTIPVTCFLLFCFIVWLL